VEGTGKAENVPETGASLSLRDASMTAGVSSPVRIRLGKGCSPGTRYASLAAPGELPCGERLSSAALYERLAGVPDVLNGRFGADVVREAADAGSPG
jgi:hypothetical protein